MHSEVDYSTQWREASSVCMRKVPEEASKLSNLELDHRSICVPFFLQVIFPTDNIYSEHTLHRIIVNVAIY